MVERLEMNGNHVLGYYENIGEQPSERVFRQHILIQDESSRRERYNDIVVSRAQVCVPEIFFGIGDYVYYIRENKTLIAVHLAEDVRDNDKS